MADRVYPAAKPNPPPAMANGGGDGGVPPKPQMYQRPIYRPQGPAKGKRGRSCRCSFCCTFCWALLVIVLLAVLAAAAGGIFYLLYRPQRPSFSVSSVRLTSFNLSSSATAPVLTDTIQLTVTAKNPNKKLVYFYDDFSFSAATSANDVPLGDVTVPGFAHQAGNTTIFTATIAAAAVTVDPSGAGSDLKKSGAFSVSVDADTRAGVKVGSLKTKKMDIQVRCDGIKVTPPTPPPAPKKVKGKNGTALAPAPALDTAETTTATVSTAAHSCTVRVRVKIGKWTF
ncbi:NDR1/HIN1-like protein 6 [Lolium rigidum]|uniref:NDR1/HIN1-like protein 6 n=1 Tax=Lolium rigidum TaxID=89674 RepID=UPI001F5C0D1C|nr:NDR1/HIN1-like protein 6 [Lolium rigidum]